MTGERPLLDDGALLRLDRVSLRYVRQRASVTAVEDISFSLAAGERLALVGPSGCGKSSLLRAIAGFMEPSAGRLLFEGQAKPAKPDPGRMMVFQDFEQLLPWRTVHGNVAFAVGIARGLGAADASRHAKDWVDRVGLGGFADAYPHTLSGGMKQRVAIARAFAVAPRILLMDEPFAALDAITRRKMQDELLALCHETRATVIFVTHDIDEAVRISTRIIAMTPHPGRIASEFVPSACGNGSRHGDEALQNSIRAAFAGSDGENRREAIHG